MQKKIFLKNSDDKTFREVKTVVYQDILFSDVKENLYESLQALNVEVSRRLKKCELIDILDELFTEKPFYISKPPTQRHVM